MAPVELSSALLTQPYVPALTLSGGHRDRGVTSIFPMVSHFCLFPFCVPVPSMANAIPMTTLGTKVFVLDSKVDLELCDQEEEIWNAVLDVIFTLSIFEAYKEWQNAE